MTAVRYYFDLVDDQSRKPDRSGGSVFETLGMAVRAAEHAARDLMVRKLLDDQDPDGRRYEIANTEGQILATVSFKDLLPPLLDKKIKPDGDVHR